MKHPRKAPSALLFAWKDTDRSSIRLLVSILATIAGLAALFIVFRVVYPESRRVNTRPQQILMLNPRVQADLALIHQAMDRSFVLLPTEQVAEPATLPVVLPAFRPSLEGFELRPKSLRGGITSSSYPRLFGSDVEVLPRLEGAAPPMASLPAQQAVLRPIVAGEIAGRLTATPALPQIPLVEPTRPRFQVAVGPSGQVMMALPLSATEDAALMQQLHDLVIGLRFAPAAEKVQWGQVSFRWEREAQP